MNATVTVRGEVDARAVEQLKRCAEAGDAVAAALCADGHVGYSQPIGGVVAYRDFISPSGVGYDIACGNKAVRTDLLATEVREDMPAIMDEVFDRVSFGMGRKNNEPVEHPVLDKIKEANFAPQRQLRDLAAKQLGTVGAGNHYVDLFEGDDGHVWVGVHFGSRGFGHKTASGFLALSQGLAFDGRGSEGEMDSPPVLFHVDSDLGQSYIEAMSLAGEYAYAGRDVVVDKVLEILGAESVFEVHNHHNFAWRERHFGEDVWVVRKGCTPAFPGQAGFVGATMGEASVILEGVESSAGESLLMSTVHGAGRVMSRTAAAGKKRRRSSCNNRDCDWVQPPNSQKPTECPQCGSTSFGKRWVQEKAGLIDFPAVRRDLVLKGIELRGGAADEAPGAYKRLHEVLAAHDDTVRVLHELTPIGVAMASPDEFDPFKD
jgi:tRNA-splicing ligase RtcB